MPSEWYRNGIGIFERLNFKNLPSVHPLKFVPHPIRQDGLKSDKFTKFIFFRNTLKPAWKIFLSRNCLNASIFFLTLQQISHFIIVCYNLHSSNNWFSKLVFRLAAWRVPHTSAPNAAKSCNNGRLRGAMEKWTIWPVMWPWTSISV